MVIYNIKDKLEYLEEIVVLTKREWGKRGITNQEIEKKLYK